MVREFMKIIKTVQMSLSDIMHKKNDSTNRTSTNNFIHVSTKTIQILRLFYNTEYNLIYYNCARNHSISISKESKIKF